MNSTHLVNFSCKLIQKISIELVCAAHTHTHSHYMFYVHIRCIHLLFFPIIIELFASVVGLFSFPLFSNTRKRKTSKNSPQLLKMPEKYFIKIVFVCFCRIDSERRREIGRVYCTADCVPLEFYTVCLCVCFSL